MPLRMNAWGYFVSGNHNNENDNNNYSIHYIYMCYENNLDPILL